jgi:hypothetical protein
MRVDASYLFSLTKIRPNHAPYEDYGSGLLSALMFKGLSR